MKKTTFLSWIRSVLIVSLAYSFLGYSGSTELLSRRHREYVGFRQR